MSNQLVANTKNDLQELLTKYKPQIAAALPKHLTPERLIRTVMTTISRNPMLLKCTQTSILGCAVEGAQLGLEFGAMSQCHMVPYYNGKTKRHEAIFIPDYRGLIALAMRSTAVKGIVPGIVYRGDGFEYSFGIKQEFKHIPDPDGEKTKENIKYVYAYAHMSDGGFIPIVLTIAEVNKVKNASKAKDRGPWVDWFEEMAKKTAVKRLCKLLPASAEIMRAVELDNLSEMGKQELTPEKIDTDTGFIELPAVEVKSDGHDMEEPEEKDAEPVTAEPDGQKIPTVDDELNDLIDIVNNSKAPVKKKYNEMLEAFLTEKNNELIMLSDDEKKELIVKIKELLG